MIRENQELPGVQQSIGINSVIQSGHAQCIVMEQSDAPDANAGVFIVTN